MKMPAITSIAFIVGYVDAVCRIVAWMAGTGGLILLRILFLAIVIAANNGKQWARIAWSLWLLVGIIVSCRLVAASSSESTLGGLAAILFIFGIIVPAFLLVLLWHPETTRWFASQRENRE